MAAVTIQNFAIDGSDLGSFIGNIDGLDDIQTFLPPTASFLQVTFTDGRTIQLTGAFQPVVDAVATLNLDIVLNRIDELRIDTVSVSVGGQPYISITDLDLHGADVASFVTGADLEGGIAFVFSTDDTIVSGPGDDTLLGFAGDDIVLGMDGSDEVFGGPGDDEINGNRGEDFVSGGDGRDFARGGQQNDLVTGDDGDDWHLNGNNNDDTVLGGNGNDSVFGGQNNDYLLGGEGDDNISGDLGNDTLNGDFGADWFFFGSGSGDDVIEDFFPDEDADKISIQSGVNGTNLTTGAAVLAATTDSPDGAVINLGGGNSILVFGRPKSFLLEADFTFF